MGSLLSNVFVCIFFCLVCCSGVSAKGSPFIKVIVDQNYNYSTTYQSGWGSPTLPQGYALAGYMPSLQRGDCSLGACPLPGKLITKVRPAAMLCAPVGCLPPPPPGRPCLLPRRQWGQIELEAQVFYARLSGRFGRSAWNFPAGWFDADLNLDAGVPDHAWVQEYSARCQFRPHWGVMYSMMLVRELDLTYQRVGLIYDAISTCNAKLAIFGSWLLNDQRVHYVNNPICGSTSCVILDRTRNMVQAGAELQRCIKTLCNGSTFSCDNRVGVGFLDNTFNLDVQAGFRFAVPVGGRKWGYVRGGYRLVEFNEQRPDLRMDLHLEGGFAELGVIF